MRHSPLELMMPLGLAMIGLGFGLAQPRAAEAPGISVAGLWAVVIEQPRRRCRWEGSVRLEQRGDRIAGSGEAKPVGHNRRCPLLKGKIDGKVDGNSVRFGFATGRLGVADFEGTLGEGGRTMSGRWRGRSAAGQWRAERAR